MQERDFIYWLNGFLELSGATTLNEEQVKVIKEHIALVITKVTPTIVGTPYIAPSPILDKGWEVTCQTTGVDLNLPNCECHGTGNQEQLPIVNLTTCLTC